MANIWEVKTVWDDFFYQVFNILIRARYIKEGGAKGHGLTKNISLRDCNKGKRAFIVGNGPSINQQNLKVLTNELVFFVNRGFLHPDYESIKPTYHIFIDPKMATGEWPLSFVDQAAEKNKDVEFIMNGRWFNMPEFEPYKKKYKIHWTMQSLFFQPWRKACVDLTRIGPGGAVVEQGILFALYMGCRDIFFLGVDGNGLCHNLIGEESHFYGVNEEDIESSYSDIWRDLSMMSNSLRRWAILSKFCAARNVNLVNLTKGGIINCCARNSLEDIVTKKHAP
ncbi:MAG: 6-hydroxymethylpterin diphosphokinase MptE-like protein [Sedimenticola sp.]